MALKVRNILLANQQRFYTITEDNDLPPNWFTSFFISCELYLDGCSLSTMRNNVYALKFFLEWLSDNTINLETRIKSGHSLTSVEISSFILSAKLANDSDKKVVDLKPYLSAKKTLNSIHGKKVVGRIVNPITTNLRISMAVRFVDFLFRHLHLGIPSQESINNFERVKFELLDAKPKKSHAASMGRVYNGFNSAIPSNIYRQLLEIISPEHPKNPFGHATAKRNQIMIEILCLTGIRRGALLKTKLQDLNLTSHNSILQVTRTPRDKTDPRRHQPAQKTGEHATFLAIEIVRDITQYISNERSNYSEAYSHDFLFVTSKDSANTRAGSPLSNSALDEIFKKLSGVLEFRIHAHLLRHKWNELFSIKVEKLGLSPDDAEKRRVDAMGWTKGSEMPSRYNQFIRFQKVHQLQKLLQEELLQNATTRD
ncbi:site-specific integrase [Alteromonadaceae bacterium M269]|nr:site-specific integrase [Alteromonadaceae bacterium M269]